MTQLKTLSSTNPKLAMHTTYKNEIIVFLPTFTPFLNVQPQKFTQKIFSTSEPIGETIPCSILPNFPLGKAKKTPSAPLQSRAALVTKQQPKWLPQVSFMLPFHASMQLAISQFISILLFLSQNWISALPTPTPQPSRNVSPLTWT